MVEKNHWLAQDPAWQAMSPERKAAVMALLEDGNTTGAYHVAGAMVNRAAADSARFGRPVDLGEHVSSDTYQPNFDISAKKRYYDLMKDNGGQGDSRIDRIAAWIEQRQLGQTPDNVNGATHFLEDPKTMKQAEANDPSYKNWGTSGQNWTAHDPRLPDSAPYGYEVFRPNAEGKGHRFLRPIEYGGSINYDPSQVAVGATSGADAHALGSAPTSGSGAGMAVPGKEDTAAALPTVRRFEPEPGFPPTTDAQGASIPGSPTPQTAPQRGNPLTSLLQSVGVTPPPGGPIGSQHSVLRAVTGGAPSEGSIFQGLNALFGGGGGQADASAQGGATSTEKLPPSLVALQNAPKLAPVAPSPIIQAPQIGGHWNPNMFGPVGQLSYLNMNPFTFGQRQG